MTIHLSARLAWHDRGWDGHVCDAPSLNASCIVHQVIRELRNDAKEDASSGRHLSELNDWLPPCSRDTAAFSERGYKVIHEDPLERPDLLPVTEEIPPYSFLPAPYRWMREEFFREICESEALDIPGSPNREKTKGWVYEPERQVLLLERFWGKLEKEKSLVFFYIKANPLDETTGRILVGAGRITAMGAMVYFGSKSKSSTRYPVWSRRITHAWPEEGVLLPYQEYYRNQWDASGILCRIPPSAQTSFLFVGEHVTDDVAVGCLERLIQSVQAVKEENKARGDWDRMLTWLSQVLSEVWTERGPYPGLGSLLHFLDFDQGMAWVKIELASRLKKGEDVWPEVKAFLEGKREPGGKFRQGIKKAAAKWVKFPLAVRKLMETLVRFELTTEQIRRVIDPHERRKTGILADETAICQNPYLLAEQDWGTPDSAPISVDAIDRGMLPDGVARRILREQGVDMSSQDDCRRVRSVAIQVLKEASAEGHTLLSFRDLLDRIMKYFPEERICRPNPDVVRADSGFYNRAFVLDVESSLPLAALPQLRAFEREVVSILSRRVKMKNESPPKDWNWEEPLEKKFGAGRGGTVLPDEVERRARLEKVRALKTLYESRFCVLTGRAGTGKTSVLSVFLEGLEQLEGKREVLLLAPTGKARVRLAALTRRNAYTIHQFLLRQEWYDPKLFHLRYEGGKQAGAPTVIIDEASMIPMDLFGVLFRALDLNKVRRLILVGDPNQLPPIGPGRPFVDIIAWLEADLERSKRLARLTERVRQAETQEESMALRLADGYLREEANPGDDELLGQIAKGRAGGDLDVHFWNNLSEFKSILFMEMEKLLSIPANAEGDVELNRSLGADLGKWEMAEHWQILSPTRQQPEGTDAINREIQLKYKAKRLAWAREQGGRFFKGHRVVKPLGEQEIVWRDKVIQIINRRRKGWPRNNENLDYVANGEVGLVKTTENGQNGDYLEVVFSTQPAVSYRYYAGEVDENLELAYALTVHKAQGSERSCQEVCKRDQAASLPLTFFTAAPSTNFLPL